MASFRRPGSKRPSAFGLSFDDRDADGFNSAHLYNPHHRLTIAEQRQKLPIYEHRTHFLYLVEHTATTIVVGETGSGKTTQLPQYLHEAGWTRDGKLVACTQPRRVAAMTIAARVAEEMGSELGAEVGYGIRFEDVSTPGVTRIKFCTDGVLLREMMEDPLLTKYSVVIVDEAHERSLTTDVLLGLLKKVQQRRWDLRVVISSATIQAERMAEFFNGNSLNRRHSIRAGHSGGDHDIPEPLSTEPALLSVQGRAHAVQVQYLLQPTNDYVATAVETAININLGDLPGDILIFLTGQDECERAVAWLREENDAFQRPGARAGRRGTLPGGGGSGGELQLRLYPLPLYAGIPASAQLNAFEPPPRGTRKVVVATNVAETSVTIEGIVYVIDCMFSKQRCFNPLSGLESLVVAPISRASATQRAGRAGRVRPGYAFRLCTEEAFEQRHGLLTDVDVPEMQRSDLSGTVLQLKALVRVFSCSLALLAGFFFILFHSSHLSHFVSPRLVLNLQGIENMMKFHWLSPPPAEAMIRALETLHALGALDSDVRLSRPIGMQMAELPLDPPRARALLACAQSSCAVEGATVIAMLSVQSVWAHGETGAIDEAKGRFAVAEGDVISFLNVWRGWDTSGRKKKWAIDNFVSHRSMLRVADIRLQLMAHLRRLGLHVSSALGDVYPGSEAVEALTRVRKSLTAGFFLNAAKLSDELVDINMPDADHAGRPVYRLVRGAGSEASRTRLRIHPSSVLFRCRPQAIGLGR